MAEGINLSVKKKLTTKVTKDLHKGHKDLFLKNPLPGGARGKRH